MATALRHKTYARYEGVQLLRFVAAGMVLVSHATLYTEQRLHHGLAIWRLGAAGVDIFFLISGFVITLAARGKGSNGWADWRGFLSKRAIRIFPMYWAITTLTLVIITVFPSLSIGSTVRAEDITQWYLLFPTRNDDGRIEPLLGVGWTLYFETFFYLLITISLALKRSPFVFAPPVLLLFAAASLFRRSDWPAWSVYLSPRVLEFLLGMSIAWSIDKINAGPRLGAATLLTGLIMLVLTDPLNGSQQIIAHARSATMILAGVVWLETVLSGRISKFLLFYGAGSYTLYLIHPIVAPGIPFLMAKMRLDAPSVSIAGCIAVSLIAAAFVHKFFEVPVLAFGNSWLGRILERSNFEQLAKDQNTPSATNSD